MSLILLYAKKYQKIFYTIKILKWRLFIKLKNGEPVFSFTKMHFSNLSEAGSLFSFYESWEGQIKMKQKWCFKTMSLIYFWIF